MEVINTKIKGLKIIQQKNHKDTRGSLREIFRKKIINWDKLVFDFVTTSKKNVLRGFHFQWKCQQAKYVSVIKGKILDCVIDLRKSSKTFGNNPNDPKIFNNRNATNKNANTYRNINNGELDDSSWILDICNLSKAPSDVAVTVVAAF